MSVSYNFITGRPEDIVSSLRRTVSALTRNGRQFKVGITNNPEIRWKSYQNHYEEMLVVYKSSSLKHVRELESALIDHNWEFGDNLIGGGGGNYGEPPYYLYVVR